MFRPESEGSYLLVLFEETNTSGGGMAFKSLPVHKLGADIRSNDGRLTLTVLGAAVPLAFVIEDGTKMRRAKVLDIGLSEDI